jgi:hypothetical protein
MSTPSNVTPYNFKTHSGFISANMNSLNISTGGGYKSSAFTNSGVQPPGFFGQTNKYSNWLASIPDGTELLSTFPKGLTVNLPNYWNPGNKYSDWIQQNVTNLLTINPKGLQRNLPNYYGINNRYSDYVRDELIPYLDGNPLRPPYYMGSSTLNVDPTGNQSNLGSRAPMISKMGSPINVATIDLNNLSLPYKKLSELSQKEYRELTIKKFGLAVDTTKTGVIQKVGAINIVGSSLKPGGKGTMSDTDPLNATIRHDTNITPENALAKTTAALAMGALGGLSSPGIVSLAGGAVDSYGGIIASYNTTPFVNLKRTPVVPYNDFRTKRGWDAGDLIGKRLDGAALAARGLLQGQKVGRAVAYAAASATVGAYSVFNREATYGFGEHDNKYALRNDFTSRSHINRVWDANNEEWKKPGILQDPVAKVTAFRGDKITAIDFGASSLAGIYNWDKKKVKKKRGKNKGKDRKGLGKAIGDALNKLSTTQDFIKFYLTGPNMVSGDADATDNIMVFRAIITSLTDSFNPSWTPIQMIGRADPNYHYGGYSREINLDFTVYATDKDELKPIWRKLNGLAGYTAPEYDGTTIGLKGPWMRITIGDLFNQQPIIINSLYYTLQDADTPWETNIEKDDANMQVPRKIQVSLGATMITDYLPQNGGKFYTLAKQFGENGVPQKGSDNWLSDMGTNAEVAETQKAKR